MGITIEPPLTEFRMDNPRVHVTRFENGGVTTIQLQDGSFIVNLIRNDRPIKSVRFTDIEFAERQHRLWAEDRGGDLGKNPQIESRDFLYKGIDAGFLRIGESGPEVSNRVRFAYAHVKGVHFNPVLGEESPPGETEGTDASVDDGED